VSALSGRVSLVTGAGSGIGRAIALRWAEGGGALILVGRNAARLEATAQDIEERGGSATVETADLALPEEVARLIARVAASSERLDALIHSAGVYESGGVSETGEDALDRLFAVNTRAPLALSRGLLPLLRRSHGDVVFINSSVVQSAAPGVSHYAASKHALRGIADALRAEVNADGIRVLSVYVGRAATPMQERIFHSEGREYRAELLLQPEDVASVVVHALALPDTAEVTDLHVRPRAKL
jgi:NADP-dependent 3-hydroxy acid dehydrogenase YdfG